MARNPNAGRSSAVESVEGRPIEYLSRTASVNMGDWWFDVATIDHFWIRRRFEVMTRLAGDQLRARPRAAEIGCGNGLLQRDIEDHFGFPVAGFELNEFALKKNVSHTSPLYCYDIHQREPRFEAHFDLIFLFDVLEHIDDESGFLESAKFHLRNSGTLLVNVPAHQFFYSDYDRAAGHVRRYSRNQLKKVLQDNGFKIKAITYWGLPLVPLLLIRKMIALPGSDGSSGFDSRNSAINKLLGLFAGMEWVPQKLLGTSVMALVQKHT